MTWLVTGGAGYIGAHVVHAFRDRAPVVVLDDLSTGSREVVPDDVPLVQANVTDTARCVPRWPSTGSPGCCTWRPRRPGCPSRSR